MNYVRYFRRTDGELEVQVSENSETINWSNYRTSKLYEPDSEYQMFNGKTHKFKGFRTFQKCVVAGYKVVSLEGKVINE